MVVVGAWQEVGGDLRKKKREGYKGNFNYFLGDFK